MSTLYGLSRNFYAYTSDDGTDYQVALTVDDAAAGGFGSSVNPGVNPGFPRGWRMRIQYGTNATYGRTKTPVKDPASTQWTAPSSFSKHSQTFVAEGCIGEKRINRS